MYLYPGYQVTEQLYESSRSLVFRAIRAADGLPVVLKLLNRDYPTPEELARFRREYELTRKLGDVDGVIRVYGLEPYEHSLVMVLEDFGGTALNRSCEAQDRDHGFELPALLRLAMRIASILSALHQRQVMHKDVNPSNLVWNPETETLKLIDFGIATELSREQPEIRNPHILEGTLAYMSPEQTGRMNRAMDYRTDLYSLGATLYYLLTGHPPFQGQDALEIVHAHLAKMPQPLSASIRNSQFAIRNSQLALLSAIILKLMAKNAEDRYQSAYGLKADLEWLLANLTGLQDLSGFTPGQHDISDRFEIPQKLYGRDAEIATLLAAFEQVSQSQSLHPTSQMLFVSGYAGIGKSALVNEIQKPVAAKRGNFLSGKFDQYQRNVPYSAFIQAFQGLIRHLLSEPEPQLRQWQDRLEQAVGPNGRVLIEVIPELELILGPPPEIPELPPEQAKNRFIIVLESFVKICATADHPLVLFLDDLQWADTSSLELLHHLLLDAALGFTLLIGAYREHEVHAAHPVMLAINELQHAGVPVNTIVLAPLTHAAVRALLMDTLHRDGLTELLLRKTGGNPFFIRRFLDYLYAEQLLTFDLPTHTWQWNPETIRQVDITENVVDLMIRKIKKLPAATQQVVQLAACIGSQFDLHTLAVACERSDAATLHDLWKALQEELILPLDDAYKYIGEAKLETGPRKLDDRSAPVAFPISNFRFIHDRVQQAAYALIDDAHKADIHLKIGRLLLAGTSPVQHEERLFEIVNHLNAASALIADPSEKERLAELNLKAAQKAKTSAAHLSAFEYARNGIAFLTEDCWQRQHALTFALYREAAEAAYLTGNFDEMERCAGIAEAHARTVLQQAAIADIKIEACRSQNKLLKAIAIGRGILKSLGVKLPDQPTIPHILAELLATRLTLWGKRVEDLNHLPQMRDPEKQAIIRILSQLSGASFVVQPKLLPLIILAGMRIVVKYGNTSQSAFVYAGYALFLCGILGDIETGYRFGQLAVNILATYGARRFTSSTLMTVHAFVTHWKTHIRDTLPPFLEAYKAGLDVGDLEYSALSAYMYCNHSYLAGIPLPELERRLSIYTEAMARLRQPTVQMYQNIDHQFVRNLMREYSDAPEAPSWELCGEFYSEAQMLPKHLEANDRSAILTLYCSKLVLQYMFEQYREARKSALKAEQYLDAGLSMYTIPLFYFFDALSRLAVCHTLSTRAQRQHLKKVAVRQKKLKIWARHAPMNYLHKWYLVEAELADLRGNRSRASDAYDKAIELARQYQYLHEEALAYILAARFYRRRGQERIAGIYMREARYACRQWGALAKVQHLEKTYPQFFTASEVQPEIGKSFTLNAISTDSTETYSGTLDVATIMKASQAISGEIEYDQLLTRLMTIMMENAGAASGMLLFEEAGQWVVKTAQGTPALGSELPESIIAYVARTKAPVVLNQADREGEFTGDAYIMKHQSKSVLCLPLVNQGRLVAMLFLENRLSPGVFTSKHLEVLTLLAAQAAISIENAVLYANLEHRVAERTAELETAKQIAMEAQQTAELANQAKSEFLSNMSHELRTPLNSILGYANLLKRTKRADHPDYAGLDTIERSGTLLLSLITDLLDLARIEAHQFELHPAPFDLHECLCMVTTMFQGRAQDKGLALYVEPPSEAPLMLLGDAHRLSQILLNLVGNAVKFTDQGSVTLEVTKVTKMTRVEEELAQSAICNLRFAIIDTGIGIPAHRLHDIFSPFVQIGDHTRQRKGTGLGLAISRQLVRLMGGELYVASVEGEGSRFWFDIAWPQAPASGSQTARKTPLIIGYTGARRSIMIADDNEQNRAMLRNLLQPLGFDVLEAVDGQDALHQLVMLRGSTHPNPSLQGSEGKHWAFHHPPRSYGERGQGVSSARNLHQLHATPPVLPDLIFLDVIMPGVDGREAARQVRSSSEFDPIKIIAISADASPAVQQQMADIGCDDFLAKPLRLDHVLDCLRRHLQLEWQYAAPAESDLDISSLVFPPRQDLEILLDFAQGGYITDIRHTLARLKASDPQLLPFVARLENLANAFQFKPIIAFLTAGIKS